MRSAVIRGLCAFACALAFHAVLVMGAVRLGFFSPDNTTIAELDLTSVDLSFSDTPDETATPVAIPPAVPTEQPPPPPPPPESHPPEPPSFDLPPNSLAPVTPPQAEPRPTDVRPPLLELPEPEPPSEPPPQQETPAIAEPVVPAPSQARVATDKPPVPRRRIKPEYPRGARQRGEEGDVTLELDVSADGTVEAVRTVSSCGFPELEQAAVQAVRRARFTPARRGSADVPSTARLTLTFRLKD